MHPALRTIKDDARAAFVRVLAYLGGLATIAIVAAEALRPQALVAQADPAAPRAEWIEITRLHPAFAMTLADWDDGDVRYAMRRNVNGQGRKDILLWGDPAGRGASALVEIYRPGLEFPGFSDSAAELMARAPRLQLAEPFALADSIETKFGAVGLISFALDGGDGVKRCLGFARVFDEPLLLIAGWYCNAGPEIVERAVLACGLDRLTLLGAGSEPRLGELFARAELKRSFCGRNSALIAATPKRGGWMEQAKTPRLRGRLAAR